MEKRSVKKLYVYRRVDVDVYEVHEVNTQMAKILKRGKEEWMTVEKKPLKATESEVLAAVEKWCNVKGKSFAFVCDPIYQNSTEIVFELFDAIKVTLGFVGVETRTFGFNTFSKYGDTKFRILDICRRHQHGKSKSKEKNLISLLKYNSLLADLSLRHAVSEDGLSMLLKEQGDALNNRSNHELSILTLDNVVKRLNAKFGSKLTLYSGKFP